jgi:2-polyprenyl-6-methoxyphenol hydroxylase-like FAD-dependent oxidoreductase
MFYFIDLGKFLIVFCLVQVRIRSVEHIVEDISVSELMAQGKKYYRWGNKEDCHWEGLGGVRVSIPRNQCTMYSIFTTRDYIEDFLRKKLKQISNIEIRSNCQVNGFLSSSSQIHGVKYLDKITQKEITLESDLVVDCSGGFSQNKKWLEKAGHKINCTQVFTIFDLHI